MVAAGYYLDAVVVEFTHQIAGDPDPSGDILAVADTHIGLTLTSQGVEAAKKKVPSDGSEYVSNEKNSHEVRPVVEAIFIRSRFGWRRCRRWPVGI